MMIFVYASLLPCLFMAFVAEIKNKIVPTANRNRKTVRAIKDGSSNHL